MWKSTSGRTRKLGGICFISGMGILLFGSLFGGELLELLSRSTPRLQAKILPETPIVICVAGEGYDFATDLPDECRFSDVMTMRLLEAVRVSQIASEKGTPWRIEVSLFGRRTERLRRCLEAFFTRAGVAADKLSLLNTAANSREEIRNFLQNQETIVLVSSAWHIPRLRMIALKFGKEILPAPAGDNSWIFFSVLSLFPNERKMNAFRTVVYELLGIAETRLTL